MNNKHSRFAVKLLHILETGKPWAKEDEPEHKVRPKKNEMIMAK